MTDITELPNELLVSIFEMLPDTRSLLSVLQTDKRFYSIAKDILLQHVCLHTRSSLYQLLQKNSSKHITRSITLTRIPRMNQSEIKGDCGRQFESILQNLTTLTRLASFSLIDRNPIWSNAEEEPVGMNVLIVKLIQALPPTITSLEIDTSGYNERRKGPHICRSIGDLLPRLRILRVHIRAICSELMHRLQGQDVSVSPLRIATIRLGGSVAKFRRCNDQPGTTSFRPSQFAQMVYATQAAGALPDLQHFILTDWRCIGREAVFWRARDIATRTTTTVPGNRMIHQSIDGRSAYIFRNSEGQDLLGTLPEVHAFLEGSLSWSTSGNGSRSPPNEDGIYHFGTATPLSHFLPKFPQVVNEEFERGCGAEESAKLLQITRTDGILDDGRPEGETPRIWQLLQAYKPLT